MTGRQALNVFEDRSRVILVHTKQQIIADRDLVQRIRDARPQVIQRAAEIKIAVDVSIEKRFDAEMIAGAEVALLATVPVPLGVGNFAVIAWRTAARTSAWSSTSITRVALRLGVLALIG